MVKIYKLSANETPLGASPKAIAAFHQSAASLALYPDENAAKLRAAIGERYAVASDRIACGAGSDELLATIARTYIKPGDEGLFSEHGFLVFGLYTSGAGGTPIAAPERDFRADVDALLARTTSKTRVVFLANPNNPTGTYLPISEIKRLHAGLPAEVLLVLDAAYAEYVNRSDYCSGLQLALSAPNVVMTRTFSKIHGLAGLRLGWLVGAHSILENLNRVRSPFVANAAAVAAGCAAISDEAHVRRSVAFNDEWMGRLTWSLEDIGLVVTPSVANFLLIHFPAEPGRSALEAEAFLTNRGLLLRELTSYGLPNALRLTVGSPEANELVVGALGTFMRRNRVSVG